MAAGGILARRGRCYDAANPLPYCSVVMTVGVIHWLP